MGRLLGKEGITQFGRFLGVGVLNTVIGLGTIFLGMAVLHLHYVIANIIGYSLALVNSFFLNRSWTFRNHESITWGKIARFLFVFAVSYGVQVGILVLLKEGLQVNAYVAQVFSIASYTAVNFVGNKFITFEGKRWAHSSK